MATVPTISELVRDRVSSGVNTGALQELTSGAGLPSEARVLRQQFDQLFAGDVKGWPREPEKIRGYAAALGVDERTVVLAFARQLGVEVEDNRSALAAMLPQSAERLTTAQAIAIADVVRVFAPQSDSQVEIPNLRGTPGEEMRQIFDLWTELTGRATSSPPMVAKVLESLAHVVNAAIETAKQ